MATQTTYVNKAGNEITKEVYDKLSPVLKSRYTAKTKAVAVPKEVAPKEEAKKKSE